MTETLPLVLWSIHENRFLPPDGDRTPDRRRADGTRPDRTGARRRREQRRRHGHLTGTVLPAAGLSRGDPPRAGAHLQAVWREPAPALPRRGPIRHLLGRAGARPLSLLGRSDSVHRARP